MARSSTSSTTTTKDAQALFQSLRSAYVATPTNLKIIDLYVMFAIFTAVIQLREPAPSSTSHMPLAGVPFVMCPFTGSHSQQGQAPRADTITMEKLIFPLPAENSRAPNSLGLVLRTCSLRWNPFYKTQTRKLATRFLSCPISIDLDGLCIKWEAARQSHKRSCFLVTGPVVYMAIVGSFPFNSFLSGVLSCVGTAVLAVCLRIQVNKENKEFKDLPPERAFCRFCTMQSGASFGDYEFPWIVGRRRELCLCLIRPVTGTSRNSLAFISLKRRHVGWSMYWAGLKIETPASVVDL
ncbi:hypothetical protein IFM89_016784 [Coptis chinensis]|uniref:Dolichyl-diphosphooligosaccharide--protein glycosyltransferase subunit DAD1 n=1 Tax=Coptis chinensis TaxID=261450 RepID=A0A835GXT0_9MAGN|nr:hypothetical protein IFM89_016784 [Coptis chinensis]